MNRPRRARLLLAGVLVTLTIASGRADAIDIVVEDGAAATGTVTLRPAIAAVIEGSPAVFTVGNGGGIAVDAEVRLSRVGVAAGSDAGTSDTRIHLEPGELARIQVPAGDVDGGLGRLEVALAGADDADAATLVAFVIEDPAPADVQVDMVDDGVVVSSDAPTVVSIQARRRSWLGTVSSQVSTPSALLQPDHVVELGGAPWLPGPSWTDVLVVDPAGSETRVTIRTMSPVRDAVILAGLLLFAVAAGANLRARRSGSQPLPD